MTQPQTLPFVVDDNQNDSNTNNVTQQQKENKSEQSNTQPEAALGQLVRVLLVNRTEAKQVKNRLEAIGYLNKNFRMTTTTTTISKAISTPTNVISDGNYSTDSTTTSSCTCTTQAIAVPLSSHVDAASLLQPSSSILDGITILGVDEVFCPYSTSVLGNHNHIPPVMNHHAASEFNTTTFMTLVQHGVMKAFQELLRTNQSIILASTGVASTNPTTSSLNNTNIGDTTDDTSILTLIQNELFLLNSKTCPNTLQYLGDDKTLVIPLRSFDCDHDDEFKTFLVSSLEKCCGSIIIPEEGIDQNEPWTTECRCEHFMKYYLWKQLAMVFSSHRVVRRGEINRDSQIRLSEYKILYPMKQNDHIIINQQQAEEQHQRAVVEEEKDDKQQQQLGPNSPGWITVTEQGIRQSFDLTLVMFSRGNITEKIRFGQQLVQPGDVVLDLYAGIGYFTLPALVHGGAEHVYACEWNETAVQCLQYNLVDNGVHHRATVLVGDCRQSAAQNNLVNMFDRISLGLLPSSEGGWRTAIRALKATTGGWLHVHGNVKIVEVQVWVNWLCTKLQHYVQMDCPHILNPNEWIIVATHVEKVKSFAPTVNHYVVDVFVGPRALLPGTVRDTIQKDDPTFTMGSSGNNIVTIQRNGQYQQLLVTDKDDNIIVPSCALSVDGILNQKWLQDNEVTN